VNLSTVSLIPLLITALVPPDAFTHVTSGIGEPHAEQGIYISEPSCTSFVVNVAKVIFG
jgi:hypothetical protein